MAWIEFTLSDDEKQRLAAAFLRYPSEPLKAAISVFGAAEIGKASWAAFALVQDTEILALQAKLIVSADGLKHLLPTKEAVALRLWNWSDQAFELDDKIKATKLLCEILDYIPKPGTNINFNKVVNKVMLVPTAASDEEWEKNIAEQQAKLVADAKSVH
jgi:hypothetical protein